MAKRGSVAPPALSHRPGTQRRPLQLWPTPDVGAGGGVGRGGGPGRRSSQVLF